MRVSVKVDLDSVACPNIKRLKPKQKQVLRHLMDKKAWIADWNVINEFRRECYVSDGNNYLLKVPNDRTDSLIKRDILILKTTLTPALDVEYRQHVLNPLAELMLRKSIFNIKNS